MDEKELLREFQLWIIDKNGPLTKAAWLESARRADKRNMDRICELEAALTEIALYAHDNSTGPADLDHLWEIRRIAYDAL